MTLYIELFIRLLLSLAIILIIYKTLHLVITKMLIFANREKTEAAISDMEELIKQKQIELESKET